jgi:hypothetical protein
VCIERSARHENRKSKKAGAKGNGGPKARGREDKVRQDY